MRTKDGSPLIWMEASDDGNLEEGWAVLGDDDQECPTLCIYFERR